MKESDHQVLDVKFENDFQLKYMAQSFAPGSVIATADDVLAWKTAWTAALKSWHSPYKCLIDATNLTISATIGDDVKAALSRTFKFFDGFFLRKVTAFGPLATANLALLPCPTFATEDEARTELGIRERGTIGQGGSLRDQIQIQNHFRQHVVEINLTEPVTFDTEEKLAVLKSKLVNNLTQWHSKWSLLLDCANIEIPLVMHPAFARLQKFLNGFFMKEVIGYSPRVAKDQYPFEAYRVRHQAAARLDGEGNLSGDEAQCKSDAKP